MSFRNHCSCSPLFSRKILGIYILGTRDFSGAASLFCQVFIVTRAKSFFSRGLGLGPTPKSPTARDRHIFYTEKRTTTSTRFSQIFPILSSAHAWTSVILAGKRDSYRHSTTNFSENVVVAEQVIKCNKSYHFASGRGLNLLQYK